MKQLKNLLSLAFFCLSIFFNASQVHSQEYAIQTYEDYSPESANFNSCPTYAFDLTFRSLILQPCSSNLNYAVEAFPLPFVSPNWSIFEIRPDYHFGFDLGIEATSLERNVNVALSWEHFYSKDSASQQVSSSNMIGPLFEIGPDALLYKIAQGQVCFHFDSISLDFGLPFQFGECLKANFFAGLNFTRLKQNLLARFSSLDRTTVRTINTPSSFHGAGPQLGVDFSYPLLKGFYFTGEAEAALLTGTLKNHTTYEAFSPLLVPLGVTPPNVQNTFSQNRTQTVPTFGGRLGVAYLLTLCDKYTVNLEAGYEARIYINAIQSNDISSEVVTPPVAPDSIGVFARTFHRTLSNFALSGPYLAINVGF